MYIIEIGAWCYLSLILSKDFNVGNGIVLARFKKPVQINVPVYCLIGM